MGRMGLSRSADLSEKGFAGRIVETKISYISYMLNAK